MYMPVSFGFFTLATLLMVVIGNLITTYKMHRRTLEHIEKCCGCNKKEDKKEENKNSSIGDVIKSGGDVTKAIGSAVDAISHLK